MMMSIRGKARKNAFSGRKRGDGAGGEGRKIGQDDRTREGGGGWGGATVSARGGARGAFRPVARRARRRSVRGSGLRGGGRRLDRRGEGRSVPPRARARGKKDARASAPEGVRPPARGSIDRGGARSAGALGARRGRRGLRDASLAGARSRGARGRVASSKREAPEGDRRGEPHRSERRPRPADVGGEGVERRSRARNAPCRVVSRALVRACVLKSGLPSTRCARASFTRTSYLASSARRRADRR